MFFATGDGKEKRAVDISLDEEEQCGLVRWVQDSIKEGKLKHIIDSDVRGEISPKCLKEFVRITERCLDNSPKQRPTMAEVVVSLENALAIQEQFNYSLQSAGRKIFGRMVNMFAFSSKGGNSVQGDSSNRKGNNRSSVRVDNCHLSIKSNIYSFGVVLLESLTSRHSVILADDVPHNLVNQASQAKSNRRKLKKIMDPRLRQLPPTRKRAVDRSLDDDEWGLVTWAQDSIKEGNLKRIIDSNIWGEISPKCLKEFVRIAERCLHSSPKQRPTMAEVVVSLESVLAVQEKFNNSLQAAGRTMFGRMVDLLRFPSNKENSVKGDSKLSSNSNGNNRSTVRAITEVPAHFQSPNPSVKAEVNFLGHMDHPNIIRLLGYCRDETEHLLVYEYMPNRSFDRFLFTDIAKRLSWGTRLLIMIGVARGLTYLHSEKLMCRGLKSGDILLDENFNAKLGDFGLVKYGPETGETHVTTRVMGTYGYAAPEYISTGHLTTKSDIYAFGTVLLVSITGQRALDVRRPKGQQSLIDWASSIQSNRRNLKKIMDPRLEHKYPLQGAFECVALALRCVANKPKDRPSSEEVLQSLEQIYALYN
ncbi:hypothetical protein L1987_30802 [Smallanthus sonchifolius]|uniref:Uncharacterized protein n=1 Tax=Smallanthus sonchifolius TaxID=185202 RepID=A0ACB9I5B8_9ASTR|nr:hypothetical protein L1987_30802 [Smallanthus sonchifolius]